MADTPRPPAPILDRAALERVLARAAELQTRTGDTDAADSFTEEQLVDLGKEVGLSPQHLRQALAEERTRSVLPDDEGGLTASILGPAHARAARIVPGRAGDVLDAIDDWMQRQELLTTKRHLGDRITWEARKDFVVNVKRGLRVGGRDYALSRADEVSATVVAVDDSRVHVALDADFVPQRRRAGALVGGSVLVGAAAGGTLLVLGIMAAAAAAPVAALPVIATIAERTWRRHMVSRSQLALEQLLDRLERGQIERPAPTSLIGAIVAAATAPKRPR